MALATKFPFNPGIIALQKYKDNVSGFEGYATAIYAYPNGCVHVELNGADKDGMPCRKVFPSTQLIELEGNAHVGEGNLPSFPTYDEVVPYTPVRIQHLDFQGTISGVYSFANGSLRVGVTARELTPEGKMRVIEADVQEIEVLHPTQAPAPLPATAGTGGPRLTSHSSF